MCRLNQSESVVLGEIDEVLQHSDPFPPPAQVGDTLRTSAPHGTPLRKLTDGDEGNAHGVSG